MPIYTRICFISLASFLIFSLGAYGIGGLINNSFKLEHTSFRGHWPLNHRPGIMILRGCQIAFIIAVIPGLIGIVRGRIVFIFLPAFIYLGVLSTLSVLGFVALNDSSKDMTHEITDYLNKSNDLQWISIIQWENECCGVKSYMDYHLLKFNKLEQFSVPYSCCKRNEQVPTPNCGIGILGPSKPISEIEQVVISKGCNTFISSEQSKVLSALGIEMVLVGVYAGFLVLFLYWGVICLGFQEVNERNSNDLENPVDSENVTRCSQNIANGTVTKNTSDTLENSDFIDDARTLIESTVVEQHQQVIVEDLIAQSGEMTFPDNIIAEPGLEIDELVGCIEFMIIQNN